MPRPRVDIRGDELPRLQRLLAECHELGFLLSGGQMQRVLKALESIVRVVEEQQREIERVKDRIKWDEDENTHEVEG